MQPTPPAVAAPAPPAPPREGTDGSKDTPHRTRFIRLLDGCKDTPPLLARLETDECPPELPPGTRFIRLLWTDVAGLRRARVVPASNWVPAGPPRWPGVALAEVCLALQTLSDAPAWPADLPRPGAAILSPGTGARVVPLLGTCHAMVACDIVEPKERCDGRRGQPLATCPRSALTWAVRALAADADLDARVGFEVEFRLLVRGGGGGDPPPSRQAAPAATGPAAYALASTLDAATPILDAIAAGLEFAGIDLLQYHGESGTGAFEVVTGPARPVAAVDNLLYTRQIIATVAAGAGYDVTFAPKPVAGEAGLGAHVHISVWRRGVCLTTPNDGQAGPGDNVGRWFLSGILNRMDGLLAITAGSPASFERMQPGAWAGAHQRWAPEDKEAPLRYIPQTGAPRFEVKCLDATANPYLAVAAILAAGLRGVTAGEALGPPAAPLEAGGEVRDDLDGRPPPGARLPQTVEAALTAFRRTEVAEALNHVIPAPLLELTAAVRRADAAAAAQVAAGPGGPNALGAAFNRVYS